jgi:hypothetical protein
VALRSAAICVIALLSLVSTPVEAERLPARIFTTADGLANNVVRRIVHDSTTKIEVCARGR